LGELQAPGSLDSSVKGLLGSEPAGCAKSVVTPPARPNTVDAPRREPALKPAATVPPWIIWLLAIQMPPRKPDDAQIMIALCPAVPAAPNSW
jgi:hypothetical protein